MTEDRRKYERVILEKEVELYDEENSWQVRLVDISLKGLLVETPPGLAVEQGDKFTIKLPLESVNDEAITMDVRVAHVEEDKAGFSWETIDVESFTHLRQLIKYNLGDPREVERELKTLFKQN